jgi:nitroimidazol reductase NimA-like FMN-containing flavoprotein (pyridoxamine 5'-phosphate oxidase superfamily)
MTDAARTQAEFRPDRAMCLALIASQPIGRLVVSAFEPVVIPVNFVLLDETIVFRVDATSSVAHAVGERVAFEVDQIYEAARTGWSVVARGVLEYASDLAVEALDLLGCLVPWAPGAKDCWLQIRVGHVTARWVHADGEMVDDRRGYL